MPLLYHWCGDNYRRDLDFGASYNLNQTNPLLHQLEVGDSLWAFTRTKSNKYVLAAELIIVAKTLNSLDYRYGKYRVWDDLKKSRCFETESQPNIESLLRSLSCKTNARVLGHAFHGYAAN